MASSSVYQRIRVADRPALITREAAGRGLFGGAVGIALWCSLFALQLLPGSLGDTPGVVTMGVAGVLAGIGRLRRWLHGALQLMAWTVTIVALSPLSETIAARWVREDVLPVSGVNAVVVLSGGLNPDTTISSEALDHLVSGLDLIREGKSPLLVTTTTREVFPTGLVDGQVDQARLIALFGSRVEWIRTPAGRSTHDEAIESAKLLRPRGIRSVAVIASPMHTRRACATFEAVGFSVVCVSARLRTAGGRPLRPNPPDRLAVFGQWIYEISATIEYRLRNWLPRSASTTHAAIDATRALLHEYPCRQTPSGTELTLLSDLARHGTDRS